MNGNTSPNTDGLFIACNCGPKTKTYHWIWVRVGDEYTDIVFCGKAEIKQLNMSGGDRGEIESRISSLVDI